LTFLPADVIERTDRDGDLLADLVSLDILARPALP
jgi:hypothetical protein